MIVCDEAHQLADCFDSVRGVVDEIVVVDTGSEDDTVATARKLGARVYHFPWCDDFAAARNESLRHARGDWVLCLDADERLLASSREEVRRCVTQTGLTYFSVLIESPGPEGRPGHLNRVHRLFRRVPEARFTGRVHEQIAPSLSGPAHRAGESSIRIRHTGYAQPAEEMARKRARNQRLLERQIVDDPGNFYWYFCLAQLHLQSGRDRVALASLKQALMRGPIPNDTLCAIWNNMAEIHLRLGEPEQAAAFARRALELVPNQVMAHLLLYQIHAAAGDRQKQIRSLEAAADRLNRPESLASGTITEAAVEPAAVQLALARLYLREGRVAQARKTYERLLKNEPENVAALCGLARCHLSEARDADAEALLQAALQAEPTEEVLLEEIAWLALKLQRLPDAARCYERLLARQPENARLKRRLAGLYHKLGRSQEARALLADSFEK